MKAEHSDDDAALAARVRELLQQDGSSFLAQAYLLLLGRPIDNAGLQSYASELDAGASKLSVLITLGRSAEGRAHGWPLERALNLLSGDGRGAAPAAEPGSLEQLLALDDATFVDAAYRTLLRRAPDPGGFTHHLKLLREQGASKLRIVWGLRRSPEGRSRDLSLPGLRRGLLTYQLARSRLTRWWFKPLTGTEGDTPAECRLRSLEWRMSRLEAAHKASPNRRDVDALEDLVSVLNAVLDHRDL